MRLFAHIYPAVVDIPERYSPGNDDAVGSIVAKKMSNVEVATPKGKKPPLMTIDSKGDTQDWFNTSTSPYITDIHLQVV